MFGKKLKIFMNKHLTKENNLDGGNTSDDDTESGTPDGGSSSSGQRKRERNTSDGVSSSSSSSGDDSKAELIEVKTCRKWLIRTGGFFSRLFKRLCCLNVDVVE